MCTIEAGQRGQVTTMDMPYKITQVRACQGHDQSLIDKVGTYPLVKTIISMDPDFDVEDLRLGFIPRIPCYPHLEEKLVPEEFTRSSITILRGRRCKPSSAVAFSQGQYRAKVMST